MTNLYNIYKHDTALQDVQPFRKGEGSRKAQLPVPRASGRGLDLRAKA